MRLSEYFDSQSADQNLARALEYSFRFSINLHSNPQVEVLIDDRPAVFIPTFQHIHNTFGVKRADDIIIDVKRYSYGYKNDESYIMFTVSAAYYEAGDMIYIKIDKHVDNSVL